MPLVVLYLAAMTVALLVWAYLAARDRDKFSALVCSCGAATVLWLAKACSLGTGVFKGVSSWVINAPVIILVLVLCYAFIKGRKMKNLTSRS